MTVVGSTTIHLFNMAKLACKIVCMSLQKSLSVHLHMYFFERVWDVFVIINNNNNLYCALVVLDNFLFP